MTIQIIECEQNSPAWFAARLGLPTASEFATILAKGEGKTRRTYMLKLAGEIITGEPMESYTSAAMERGKIMEDEARTAYELLHNVDCERVGFIRNGNTGCSPDSLLGKNGMLEIKTALPHILIAQLLKGDFPLEHKAQCQGQLWVAERDWIDIAIYWPKLPLFVCRASRDRFYIDNLSSEVKRFNSELIEVVDKIRRYGKPLVNILSAG